VHLTHKLLPRAQIACFIATAAAGGRSLNPDRQSPCCNRSVLASTVANLYVWMLQNTASVLICALLESAGVVGYGLCAHTFIGSEAVVGEQIGCEE
jgi:hypothetical protein